MTRDASSTPARLEAVLDDLIFVPTHQMRRAKASWQAYLESNPLASPTSAPRLADVVAATRDNRVRQWWQVPGFLDWFTNSDEFRSRVEYLAHSALDCIEELLEDRDANANARIRAAQLILEAAAKFPGRDQAPVVLDAVVQKMSPEELRAFISKKTGRLEAATPPPREEET